MAIADTVNEINSIINDLKALADAGNKLDGTAKTTMETRIARLRDKSSGTTILTDDLNDLATKASAPAITGKTPIVGLGWRLIGLKA
jgi:hypothetical protein